ncbi:GSCOCG00010893001-RA-CDS [Cotesia congregata]|nr:GSCOCG00010893001-RA-CDS [Cotesia congregata]
MNGFLVICLLGCAVLAAAQNPDQGPPRPGMAPPPPPPGGMPGGAGSGGMSGGFSAQAGGQASGLGGSDSNNERQKRSASDVGAENFFVEIDEKLFPNGVVNGGARGRRSPQGRQGPKPEPPKFSNF